MNSVARALLKAGMITKEQAEAVEKEKRTRYEQEARKKEKAPIPNAPLAAGKN